MEILYSEPITEAPSWLLVVLLIAVIFTFVAGTSYHETGSDFAGIFATACGILSVCCFLYIIYANDKFETGRTRYEVILDEDYPVSKLYEDYIVKEQQGKIWILEDKEASE